jgi:predicted  nucleic acid-binding Zn-ribbon protein
MSDYEAIHLRLEALEEWRREQSITNKTITESLHRIEMALQRSTDKACPAPGHCIILERDVKSKSEADKERFSEIEANYTKLESDISELKKALNHGLGALGVLIAAASFIIPYLISFFQK